MQRIVINKCFGGFGLSKKAIDLYKTKTEMEDDFNLYAHDIERDDPILIEVIEELGEEANGACAELKIVEIPDDVKWEIEEYDGIEWVSEVHRTWG